MCCDWQHLVVAHPASARTDHAVVPPTGTDQAAPPNAARHSTSQPQNQTPKQLEIAVRIEQLGRSLEAAWSSALPRTNYIAPEHRTLANRLLDQARRLADAPGVSPEVVEDLLKEVRSFTARPERPRSCATYGHRPSCATKCCQTQHQPTPEPNTKAIGGRRAYRTARKIARSGRIKCIAKNELHHARTSQSGKSLIGPSPTTSRCSRCFARGGRRSSERGKKSHRPTRTTTQCCIH